jgi:hypothetical protein
LNPVRLAEYAERNQKNSKGVEIAIVIGENILEV